MSTLHHRRRLRRLGILLFHALLVLPIAAYADGRDALHWLSWTAFQAVPSPTFTIDHGHGRNAVVTSFRWQITPVSYSWSANEFVSPVSYFKVNPVRRHGGSVQVDLQPEIGSRNLSNANLGRSSFAIGSRAFFPIAEYGEYLSFSVGGKYVFRNSIDGNKVNSLAGEIGLYTLFGLVGVQFDLDSNPAVRYSLSLCLRYY